MLSAVLYTHHYAYYLPSPYCYMRHHASCNPNYISNQLHIQRPHTAIRTTIYAICRPIYVPLYISGTIYTYHYIYIAIRTTIYAICRPIYVPLYILYTTTMYHYVCYLPSPYCYISSAPTSCRPSCAYCCMYISRLPHAAVCISSALFRILLYVYLAPASAYCCMYI
jgi:hypothetical protein